MLGIMKYMHVDMEIRIRGQKKGYLKWFKLTT